MAKIKEISKISLEDLSQLIEEKILEIIGDPDYGLELRDEFKSKIIRRLQQKGKRIPHKKVVERFG